MYFAVKFVSNKQKMILSRRQSRGENQKYKEDKEDQKKRFCPLNIKKTRVRCWKKNVSSSNSLINECSSFYLPFFPN